MFSKFSWLGICLCAVVSLAGTLSYGSSIDFGNCAQINLIATPGVVCPNTDATKSQITYSNGGLSVTATGFLNAGGRENLYVKQSTPGETGLGTVIDTADHEITADDFVNLDFSNLLANKITTAQITIESLQTGEDFKLCQGGAVGAMGLINCHTGTELGSTLTNTITLSWTSAADDIFGVQGFGVAGADVLVQGMTFTIPTPPPPPVPEPASLLLFGSGIVALAVKKRNRSNKQIEAV